MPTTVNKVWNTLFLDMAHTEGQQHSLVSVRAVQRCVDFH